MLCSIDEFQLPQNLSSQQSPSWIESNELELLYVYGIEDTSVTSTSNKFSGSFLILFESIEVIILIYHLISISLFYYFLDLLLISSWITLTNSSYSIK